MNISPSTYYHRLERDWSVEEAACCPVDMPLWMWRIEQEEGRSLRDMLAEGARAAKVTGYSLSDMADEWGVSRSKLGHWARKWGIHFPNHCSTRHRESAARIVQTVRPCLHRTLSSEDRARRHRALARALVSVGGNQRALASLLGCRFTAVNDWLHDRRQIPDHWWSRLQEVVA